MSPAGPCVGDGGRVRLPSGKTLVDYDMDGGRVLVGRGDPEIDAARLIDGPVPREPFTAVAHLLGRDVGEVTAIAAAVSDAHGGLNVSDESVLFGRVTPPAGWDLRVIGPSAAAGAEFAALLAREPALLAGVERPDPPEPAAVAAAEVVLRLAGPLVVHQLSGRAERLAFGIAEVAAGAGLHVEAVQPGGWLELGFTEADRARGVPARFQAEMRSRGFLVPAAGPWWPCLAHDYFTIEHTVDAAAAAMAVAAL
ncbi:MAG: hypothetical protein K1X95_06305 [Acidimicrobiia bacterium]|nr:hypothetical protein [Acidimicrobiia bacterium]